MTSVTTIVTIADRPDLVPVVAAWRWEEFGRANGRTASDQAGTH